MRLEGTIRHGMAVSGRHCGEDVLEVRLQGGVRMRLAGGGEVKAVIGFGPIGSYVDTSRYYTKEQTDAMLAEKQNRLTAGKDIEITVENIINNEHTFFTNSEVDDIWDIALNANK